MTILHQIITERLIKYRTPSFNNEYILTRHEIKRILGVVYKIHSKLQLIVLKELQEEGYIIRLNSQKYRIEPKKIYNPLSIKID
jgi:ribosomal protein S8